MNLPMPAGTCALCKSGERDVVQTQSLALLNRDEKSTIDFCVCASCGHLQQWPPVSPALMAHHYKTFATYEIFGDAQRLRHAPPACHTQRFLALVQDIGLAPGRAYEVGCASGEMLHQFQKRGWTVRGCDPSPSAISQARAIFDIDADLGGEESAMPRQSDLDLILACHVLEHLYDPPATLARFHAALAPQGHLVLEVPCATRPELLPPGWFTFEHLHYYQPAILDVLLRNAGFEVVEKRIDMRTHHYPVIAIAARKLAQPPLDMAGFEPANGVLLAHSYAARDNALWLATARRVARLRGPVFLYGAGIHTAQLLDRTNLTAQVIAIADRDPKKWGQTQAGKPVISPEELFAHPAKAPVVVSSYVSEKPIVDALLKGGIASSRIVPLYADMADLGHGKPATRAAG
jgi:SAM-dependent methyltransferase